MRTKRPSCDHGLVDAHRAVRRAIRCAIRPGAVLAGLAGLTLAGGLLAGCSGSSGGSGSSNGSTTAASVPAPSTSAIANVPADRSAVSQKGCRQTSSGWAASGTVTNPKAQDATYVIVISFTTKQSTVLTRGQTKVPVKAGKTKRWTVAASFAKTKNVVCVLRGVSIAK
jgi:hypothetical protein